MHSCGAFLVEKTSQQANPEPVQEVLDGTPSPGNCGKKRKRAEPGNSHRLTANLELFQADLFLVTSNKAQETHKPRVRNDAVDIHGKGQKAL